jgi:hypothetical protein
MSGLLFDIVNGFFNRCRGCIVPISKEVGHVCQSHTFILTNEYLAEINHPHRANHGSSRVVRSCGARLTRPCLERSTNVVIGGVDSQA